MEEGPSGRQIVNQLAAGADVDELLQHFGEIRRHLASKAARDAIRTRRKLGRLQTELLAARFAPHAMSRLIKLMGEDKPDVGLKAALAVIQMIAPKTDPKNKPTDPQTPTELEGPETQHLMTALAKVLREEPAETPTE